MDRTKAIIRSEIVWGTALLCISLSIMSCSTRWIDPDDLVGLNEEFQRIVRQPSQVPIALVPGSKVTRRLAPGYKFNILHGTLRQLPDGKNCWYDEKCVELEIQHRQVQMASKHVIENYTLLLRLRQPDNIGSGFKISSTTTGKQNRGFNAEPLGEGWYKIRAFISAVDNAFDAYFPVKTKVAIESDEEVCLTAVLLVKAGLIIGRPVSPDVAVEPNAPLDIPDQLYIPHQLLSRLDYKLDVQRLEGFNNPVEELRGNYTLERFEQEAERLLQKWLDKEILLYYDLTLVVCNVLDSTSWRNRGDYSKHLNFRRDAKLEIGYARLALAKSRERQTPELPLDAELRLLRRIVGDPEYFEGKLSGAAWVARRSEKMALFARGFQRLAAEIDETHDFSKELYMKPPFPPGITEALRNGKIEGGALRSGMAPSKIKDPKLRAEYEKLIVEHRREWDERRRQTILRKRNKSFSRWIGQYMVSAYLKPPHNESEMETFLERYIKDEELKETLRTKYAEGLIRYNENLQKQGTKLRATGASDSK